MKNRKLNQLLVASVISAAMMTSAIDVNAADFSDDTSAAAEQTLDAGEDETPLKGAADGFADGSSGTVFCLSVDIGTVEISGLRASDFTGGMLSVMSAISSLFL